MAKPNYSMAKRQRDLAKKAKAEEKRLRKAQALAAGEKPPDDDDTDVEDGAEHTEGLAEGLAEGPGEDTGGVTRPSDEP